ANVAQVHLTINDFAQTGPRFVTATTNGAAPVGGAAFSVTPSQAVIASLTPNTAKQQDSIVVAVVGQNTLWSQGATVFTVDGSITVSNPVVVDHTHATMTLSVAALASLGLHSITATTGGQVATLASAFVV